MGRNTEAARTLAQKLAKKGSEGDQKALAASAEGKEAAAAIEKLQEDLENIKLQLEESRSDNEALQQELQIKKESEEELHALLEERTAKNATLTEEIARLREENSSLVETIKEKDKEIRALKTKVTKLEKR